MLCIVPTPLKKQRSLACHYSDSMGVNIGKRLSLYSYKHGGVKVKIFLTVYSCIAWGSVISVYEKIHRNLYTIIGNRFDRKSRRRYTLLSDTLLVQFFLVPLRTNPLIRKTSYTQ